MHSPPRILIVDDEAVNVRMVAEALRRQYELFVAGGGAEALEVVETVAPDLILLDILMPDMSGYEVCRRLKSDELTRDIPIIFISALGEEASESEGLEAGAIDYISKPFSAAIVRLRVRNHLEMAAQRDLLRKRTAALEEALASVKTLKGLLPICASCKKIRDDSGYWNVLEQYIHTHSEADFTHGICPQCMERLYGITMADVEAEGT